MNNGVSPSPINIPVLNIPFDSVNTTLSKNLIFRQSLTNDIMSCPKMASYRWIFEFKDELNEYGEPKVPYMATLLGTAGHAVIEAMHKEKKFDFELVELMEMFQAAALEALEEYPIEPKISKGYDSVEDEIEMKAIEYAEFIEGYQMKHRKLKPKLIVTMFEQEFVLPVEYNNEIYIFNGTLDQAGIYADKRFTLRDLKFRDNAFKPNYVKLQLSHQMIIYSAALKYGVPCCKKCKPRYNEDSATFTRDIEYDGPCESCTAKIGTHEWPQVFPSVCELVWLKDFSILQRASRGRKKGDFKGKGIYEMYIKRDKIKNYMQDVLKWCHAFKNGLHPRNPGEMCIMFCDYKNQCLQELRSENINSENINSEF